MSPVKVFPPTLPIAGLAWLVVCTLLFVFAYSSTLDGIVTAWNGEEAAGSNHGWLVLACSVYLLWLKKDALLPLPLQPSPFALVLLAGCALVWLLTKVADIQAGQMALLPLLMLLAIGALCSPRHMQVALLPVGLLFFALPVWQPLLPLLQDITTVVTHFLLKLGGRPVYVVDNFIHVSGGSFVIEEACSGLRFLLVSTTLSLMNSALNKHTLKQSIVMLAIAVLLSFIANWVRVVFVIVLGDYTQMQHPWVSDHANLGWVMYVVLVLIPFFVISRYVPFADESNAASAIPPQPRRSLTLPKRSVQVLAAAALFLTPLAFSWMGAITAGNTRQPQLPSQISLSGPAGPFGQDATWNAVARPAVDSWQPAFLNTSAVLAQAYQRSGDTVMLHLAYYHQQEQGAELVNVNNHLVDDIKWRVEPGSETMLTTTHGLVVRAATVGGPQRQRVWYWYDVGGYQTSNDYVAKLYQVLAFLGGRGDAALVAISVNCAGGCDTQDVLLRDFSAMMPSDVLASDNHDK